MLNRAKERYERALAVTSALRKSSSSLIESNTALTSEIAGRIEFLTMTEITFNLVHVHKPKFGLFFCWPLPIFFLALFLSFPSAPLFPLSFTLHVLSVGLKKFGVNCE